jgi:thiol-disulfide isomerase/thioredoxin
MFSIHSEDLRRRRALEGWFILSLFTLSLLVVIAGQWERDAHAAPRLGDFFPQYTFQSPATSGERAYLGIAEAKTFTIEDIEADLVVLEIFSSYCGSCQMQAPIYNDVLRLLEEDPMTRGRVKWLGVGVGNNDTEILSFRQEEDVLFPIIPDVDFRFYDVVGGPGGVRTPLTILIRKDKRGRGIVLDSHVGFRPESKDIVDGIKAALQYDLAYVMIEDGERTLLPHTEELTPPLSDDDLLREIKRGMSIQGGSVTEVRKITLENEIIYMGRVRMKSEEKQLFAKVVSRPPLCDICHDIHFIYFFEEKGKIINFVPIHLTKDANLPWTDQDVQNMKNGLIGRSLLDPFRFNRDVDAISGATVTSVIIFDAMSRGKATYTALIRENLL